MKKENANRGYLLVLKDIIFDNRLSEFERLLLLHIGAYGEFFESSETTAKLFGVSERKVAEAKRNLVRARCIVVAKNTGRGKRYMMNQKYLWKTTPKNVEKSV